MSRRLSTLRFVALLALASLALHQLRYRIGYHEHAAEALRTQGHAYLSVLGTLAAGLLAAALAGFCAVLLRARRGRAAPAAAHFARTWAYSSASLATTYVAQEWLEGQLAAGHPGGLAGVVGHAGWIAFLLAIGLGALIALLCRGADAVIALVSGRTRKRRRGAPAPGRCPPRFTPRPLDVLARNLAGRAPPLIS